jgi:hypothetical protein
VVMTTFWNLKHLFLSEWFRWGLKGQAVPEGRCWNSTGVVDGRPSRRLRQEVASGE